MVKGSKTSGSENIHIQTIGTPHEREFLKEKTNTTNGKDMLRALMDQALKAYGYKKPQGAQ